MLPVATYGSRVHWLPPPDERAQKETDGAGYQQAASRIATDLIRNVGFHLLHICLFDVVCRLIQPIRCMPKPLRAAVSQPTRRRLLMQGFGCLMK
jgi:hypothetical protein